MNRVGPNLLLAISTAVPLLLLVLTAGVYGEPGQTVKYAVIAVTCPVLFVLLNGMLRRRQGPRPPLIRSEAAGAAAWASLFPLMVMVTAAVPFLFQGHDYGLLLIVASVIFGLTLESALQASRSA